MYTVWVQSHQKKEYITVPEIMYFSRTLWFLYFVSNSSTRHFFPSVSQWLNLMNNVHPDGAPSRTASFLFDVSQLRLCLYCYFCARSVLGVRFPCAVWLTGQKVTLPRPWRHTPLPPQSEQFEALFLFGTFYPPVVASIERKLFVFDRQRCLCLQGRGLYSGSGCVSVQVCALGVVVCAGLLSHCAAGGNCNWDWNTSAVMMPVDTQPTCVSCWAGGDRTNQLLVVADVTTKSTSNNEPLYFYPIHHCDSFKIRSSKSLSQVFAFFW